MALSGRSLQNLWQALLAASSHLHLSRQITTTHPVLTIFLNSLSRLSKHFDTPGCQLFFLLLVYCTIRGVIFARIVQTQQDISFALSCIMGRGGDDGGTGECAAWAMLVSWCKRTRAQRCGMQRARPRPRAVSDVAMPVQHIAFPR